LYATFLVNKGLYNLVTTDNANVQPPTLVPPLNDY